MRFEKFLIWIQDYTLNNKDNKDISLFFTKFSELLSKSEKERYKLLLQVIKEILKIK